MATRREVLAAAALADLKPVARSWAPQVYPQLFYWNEPNHGGHFVQLEDPLLFTDELRRCFHALKSWEAS